MKRCFCSSRLGWEAAPLQVLPCLSPSAGLAFWPSGFSLQFAGGAGLSFLPFAGGNLFFPCKAPATAPAAARPPPAVRWVPELCGRVLAREGESSALPTGGHCHHGVSGPFLLTAGAWQCRELQGTPCLHGAEGDVQGCALSLLLLLCDLKSR